MGLTQSEIIGYRVVRLLPSGPLAHSDIECFFDYIMAIDGVCPPSMDSFLNILKRSQDKKVQLAVLSIKTGQTRYVSMIPKEWSGSGLLGANVQLETVSDGYWHGLRVLSVIPGSQSESLGLRPLADYLIACATPPCIFRSLEDLETAVYPDEISRSVELVVYDSLLCQSRVVAVQAAQDKQLGLHLAVGALNSMPLPEISRSSLIEHLSTVCGGLRILKVNSDGALADLEICTFLDLIISIDDSPIRSLQAFSRKLRESLNTPILLKLENSRSGENREISITPKNGLLGATVKFEPEPIPVKSGLRVLSVVPASLAERLGLRASVDYLLGCEHPFTSSSDFAEAWSAAAGSRQKLSLFVFDSATKQMRTLEMEVAEGELLGAEIILQPLA